MSQRYHEATFTEIVATDEAARQQRAEHEAIQAAREAFFARASGAANDPPVWPAPQPLTVRIEPEPYPVDALPPAIRAAVDEVQHYVQAPLPLVASSALAALSVAIQAHVDVQRDSRLCGPVSLFIIVIADSGERKTTCDGFFMRAIRDYEAAQAEAAQPDLTRHRAALAAWESKVGGIRDRIRADAKARKATALLEVDLDALEAQRPEPPRVPRLLYGDVTPEALAWSLARGWPSGGVVSAEAGTVFGSHGMGADSVMRNLSMLNQLWDGSSLAIDRRTSESFTVRGARLSVALQVQEATVRAFFEKAGTLARGTGFMARFLVAWPQSTQGLRFFAEAPAQWPHMAAFNGRLAEILERAAPMNERGALEPQLLTLSPDARAAWIAFHDAIESQLASGGELYDVRDVASKAADNAARLAALFHVWTGEPGPVPCDAFGRAARIVAWHLSESRRFFGELALPDELADAARLDRWLVEYGKRERTLLIGKSHVLQHGPLRKAAALDDALKVLSDLDRVRVERIGKPFFVKLNPALMHGGGAA